MKHINGTEVELPKMVEGIVLLDTAKINMELLTLSDNVKIVYETEMGTITHTVKDRETGNTGFDFKEVKKS